MKFETPDQIAKRRYEDTKQQLLWVPPLSDSEDNWTILSQGKKQALIKSPKVDLRME